MGLPGFWKFWLLCSLLNKTHIPCSKELDVSKLSSEASRKSNVILSGLQFTKQWAWVCLVPSKCNCHGLQWKLQVLSTSQDQDNTARFGAKFWYMQKVQWPLKYGLRYAAKTTLIKAQILSPARPSRPLCNLYYYKHIEKCRHPFKNTILSSKERI